MKLEALMKNFALTALLVCGLAATALAGPDALEIPISSYSAVTSVSVSTSAWTNATPAEVRLTDLWAVLVDNPSTNSAIMHGHLWGCASAPTASTSTYKGPIELTAADPAYELHITEDLCLWLVSRHTAAESVMVQGVRKRR